MCSSLGDHKLTEAWFLSYSALRFPLSEHGNTELKIHAVQLNCLVP